MRRAKISALWSLIAILSLAHAIPAGSARRVWQLSDLAPLTLRHAKAPADAPAITPTLRRHVLSSRAEDRQSLRATPGLLPSQATLVPHLVARLTPADAAPRHDSTVLDNAPARAPPTLSPL